MPKKQIIGSIIIIIILSFICMYIYDNYKIETKTTIKVVENNENKEIKDYYSDKIGNYYLYNIDSIEVDFTDRDLDLDRALEAKQITMEEVLNLLTKKFETKNAKLYQKDNVSILQCELENGKYNYIFGGESMEYREGMCDKTPYLCTFDKTYYVIDISESKTNKDMYLTIRSDIDTETSTIKVKENVAANLEAKKYYKFTFGSRKENVDSEIKDVFDNNIILKTEEIIGQYIDSNNNECK